MIASWLLLAVLLTAQILAAPFAAGAQPAGKATKIGLLDIVPPSPSRLSRAN
jgi:hypothetical protein